MKSIPSFVTIAVTLACAASLQARAAEPAVQPQADPSGAVARPQLTARANLPFHAESHAAALSKGPGERDAAAAAAQGPEALRRYIDRTRMVYALRYEDFSGER